MDELSTVESRNHLRELREECPEASRARRGLILHYYYPAELSWKSVPLPENPRTRTRHQITLIP